MTEELIGPEDCELVMSMFRELTKQGALKHGANSWLEADNISLETKANFASITRHAARAYCGEKYDEETQVLHYVNIAWRAAAKAERILRGIDK